MNPTAVPAELEMVVRLQAQHWNVVISALRKLPYELVEVTLPLLSEQLQQQAVQAPANTNGAGEMRAPHDRI